LYLMLSEAFRVGQRLIDLGIDALNPFTTANAGAKAVQDGIALAGYIVSIANLLDDLSDSLFQKPRYYLGILIKTLLEKACQYLGLVLETTLFDGVYAKLSILPPKNFRGALVGRTTQDKGTPNMTFEDLLRDVCLFFNAKTKIQGGTLVMERWDHFLTPSGVQLPALKDSRNREYPYRYNASDLEATTFVQLQRDPGDWNTYKDGGYSAEHHTGLQDVLRERYNLMRGLRRVGLPFSRAKRKDSQTTLERLMNGIYDAFSSIPLPGLGRGRGLRGNRIGCMELAQDATNTTKIAIMEPSGMVSANDANYVNAKYLLENYHLLNTPGQNQQLVLTQPVPTPLTTQELALLANNPLALTADGKTVIVEGNEYDPQTELYNLKLRVLEDYTNNLTNTITDGRG